MMRGLHYVDWIAMILMVIGGLNWGIFGMAGYNVIASVFGVTTMVTRVLYMLVGLATLYIIAVAHSFRRVPTTEELERSRVVQTPSGPVACPPCP